MARTPVKKVPAKRKAPEKEYIAITNCSANEYRGPFKRAELDREVSDLLNDCCDDEECVEVFEIAAKFSIKRDRVELVPQQR